MTEITSRLSTALADRYRIESRLGEGGMATVYLAADLKHERKVALRELMIGDFGSQITDLRSGPGWGDLKSVICNL